MALTHLVDTSVLTRLHRPAIVDKVIDLASSGRLARCSISDLELGYSARHADEFDCIGATRALQVQRQLAGASRRGRSAASGVAPADGDGGDVAPRPGGLRSRDPVLRGA